MYQDCQAVEPVTTESEFAYWFRNSADKFPNRFSRCRGAFYAGVRFAEQVAKTLNPVIKAPVERVNKFVDTTGFTGQLSVEYEEGKPISVNIDGTYSL